MTSGEPISYRRLLADLREIGLPRGRHVLVHCAMSEVGRIIGGPGVLLRAIRDVIGDSAAVVVPTQTANNSTTSRYFRAATAGMSPEERIAYEAGLPGFDPETSPSHRMGALAEHVRRHRSAYRSKHPQTSFAAVGPAAAELMSTHRLASHLGEESPLAALYHADAVILLIGVGIDRCTALHLAEYRLQHPPMTMYTCFVAQRGEVKRQSFEAPDLDDSDFAVIGADLLRKPWVSSGLVGRACAHVLPIRQSVDFGVVWMERHRRPAVSVVLDRDQCIDVSRLDADRLTRVNYAESSIT